MTGYDSLSRMYDALTGNVDYARRAAYIDGLFKQNRTEGIVLDAGCGTGTLALLLAQRGYDMIGADISPAMLNEAYAKSADAGVDIRWLCQDLTKLDLYGTVNGVVCMQDTINHIEGLAKLEQVISRFSLFTEPGGLLIFDYNTPYKHREVLAENAFVFETETGLCVWRNAYEASRRRVCITVDLFERQPDGQYRRGTDSFCEYTYTDEQLSDLLHRHGYVMIQQCDGESYGEIAPDTQRILICARKEK